MIILNPGYMIVATLFIPFMSLIVLMLFYAAKDFTDATVTDEQVWSSVLVSSTDEIEDYPYRSGE